MNTHNTPNEHDRDDANLDPITGEPGAHPVGAGIGAAGGATAGAMIGAVGGPIGMAVGAVIGGLAGGLAGKGVAEAVNPTHEEAYWRDQFRNEPYYADGLEYDDYSPAYRAGYQSRMDGIDNWNDARTEWERRWDEEHAVSRLKWRDAEPAIQAAWNRANQAYLQRKEE